MCRCSTQGCERIRVAFSWERCGVSNFSCVDGSNRADRSRLSSAAIRARSKFWNGNRGDNKNDSHDDQQLNE